MAEVKQNADGSLSVIREIDNQDVARMGGSSGAAGTNVPSYLGDTKLAFNIAGGTDSAVGLLLWQNTLGYDIIVEGAVLDLTTVAAAACTASFGSSTNSTGSSANMFASKNINSATGTFTGGAVAVKVPSNQYIVGSVVSGTSSGAVARAYFTYFPAAGAAGR